MASAPVGASDAASCGRVALDEPISAQQPVEEQQDEGAADGHGETDGADRRHPMPFPEIGQRSAADQSQPRPLQLFNTGCTNAAQAAYPRVTIAAHEPNLCPILARSAVRPDLIYALFQAGSAL